MAGNTRRTRRGRRSAAENSKTIYWIVMALLAAGVICLGYWLFQNPIVQVNSLTFCPLETDLTRKRTTFLVDTTEPLVPSQVVDVQRRVSVIIQGLNEFDMVDFYAIRADKRSGIQRHKIDIDLDTLTSISKFCIPQENNWELTPTQKRLITVLQTVVSDMFLDLVERDEVQPFSPILDGLRYIAADNDAKIERHDVYVISDMLEYTPVLNMYSDGWHLNQYTENKEKFLNSRPQFRDNVRVTVWALMRPSQNKQDIHWANFWTDMISGQRGTVDLRIEKITGDI